jgi:hypothetical protein
MAAKAPHDQIMAVILAYEAEQVDALEKRRAADAERQARKRSKDQSRDVTLRHSDKPLTRDHVAQAEDKTLDTDTTSSKNTSSKDLAEFKGALASLSADQISGLVKVRKAKKAPLTGYAANLLIKAANTCQIPLSEAADLCIERNWLTVKPDWLAKPSARGSPARQPANGTHHFHSLAEEPKDEPERAFRSDQGDWNDARSLSLIPIENYRRHG